MRAREADYVTYFGRKKTLIAIGIEAIEKSKRVPHEVFSQIWTSSGVV